MRKNKPITARQERRVQRRYDRHLRHLRGEFTWWERLLNWLSFRREVARELHRIRTGEIRIRPPSWNH